ncbi:hypothetical protein RhiirA4_418878 [Rhizophagus irregularis]|uniref:Uncharacterized protein n=1 Tax=Rhizophagus irregularis TaxID=588596 RepID=A0A2I1GC89_9GLOM|nr:hypothetical protein RhiirA4_418878 [Rhizophagus irregularis]
MRANCASAFKLRIKVSYIISLKIDGHIYLKLRYKAAENWKRFVPYILFVGDSCGDNGIDIFGPFKEHTLLVQYRRISTGSVCSESREILIYDVSARDLVMKVLEPLGCIKKFSMKKQHK